MALRFINHLTQLGHDLGVKVVVEGLETPGLLEAAMILGADLGQCYALSHPMPLGDVASWSEDFDTAFGRTVRRTALGPLADFILRDEWLRMFKGDVVMVEQIIHTPCRLRSYRDTIGAGGPDQQELQKSTSGRDLKRACKPWLRHSARCVRAVPD